MQNNLNSVGTEDDIDPNRVQVTGARVKIVPPTGVTVPFRADCAAEFDHPSQSTIFPGSQRAVRVEAVRTCHAALFQDLFKSGALNPAVGESVYFRVIVRIKGHHGGTEILSDPFEFPVRICYGCLQTGFSGPYSLFNFPMTPPCAALADQPLHREPLRARPGLRSHPLLRPRRQGRDPAVSRRAHGRRRPRDARDALLP